MERDMGAIEMNFGESPAIGGWSAFDRNLLAYGDALQTAIGRFVVYDATEWVEVTNASIGSPLIVTYRTPPLAGQGDEEQGDLEALVRGAPLKVVNIGKAALRIGKLAEPEWEF
jgi:hypothetical protein